MDTKQSTLVNMRERYGLDNGAINDEDTVQYRTYKSQDLSGQLTPAEVKAIRTSNNVPPANEARESFYNDGNVADLQSTVGKSYTVNAHIESLEQNLRKLTTAHQNGNKAIPFKDCGAPENTHGYIAEWGQELLGVDGDGSRLSVEQQEYVQPEPDQFGQKHHITIQSFDGNNGDKHSPQNDHSRRGSNLDAHGNISTMTGQAVGEEGPVLMEEGVSMPKLNSVKIKQGDVSTQNALTDQGKVVEPTENRSSLSKRAAIVAKAQAAKRNPVAPYQSQSDKRSAKLKNKGRKSIMADPPKGTKPVLKPKPKPESEPELEQKPESTEQHTIINTNVLPERIANALESRTFDLSDDEQMKKLMDIIAKNYKKQAEERAQLTGAILGEINSDDALVDPEEGENKETKGPSKRLKGKARMEAKKNATK